MVGSNNILYKPNEHPDHCVVIKYVSALPVRIALLSP